MTGIGRLNPFAYITFGFRGTWYGFPAPGRLSNRPQALPSYPLYRQSFSPLVCFSLSIATTWLGSEQTNHSSKEFVGLTLANQSAAHYTKGKGKPK